LGSVLSVGLVVIAMSACGGSSGPSGTYTTTISAGEKLGELTQGKWRVRFAKNGSYEITAGEKGLRGLATGPGSYYRGSTFVITPLSELAHPCGPGSAIGRYRLQLSGNALRFIRIVDGCKTRSAILAHTFTKAP
jgi:hypothetical protein